MALVSNEIEHKSHTVSDCDSVVCWVEELNFFSLAKIGLLKYKRNIGQVRFMNACWWVRGSMKRWPKVFSFFQQGVLSWMETITEKSFVETMKDRISPEHRRSILGNFSEWAALIQKILGGHYDSEKIELFLEQEAAEDLEWPIRLINLADEFASLNSSIGTTRSLVLIKDIHCMDSVRLYAQEKSVEVATYFNSKEFGCFFYFPLKLVAEIIYNAGLIFFGRTVKKESGSDLPKVAVLNVHGADLNKRCDYFWFPASKIDPKQMIVYFKDREHSPSEETRRLIEGHKIILLDLLPKKFQLRPLFSGSMELNRFPTWGYVKRLGATLALSVKMLLACLRHDKLPIWFWMRLTRLFNDVDLFTEFFSFYGIKIHFAAYEMGRHMTASNLAIAKCGGVDATHLWSHIDCSVHQMGKPHDVYFIWGPYYKRHFFNHSFYRVRNYVYVGYIYDYCFALCKEAALLHRRKLLDCGATFIVSFFDQLVMSTPSVWNDGQEKLYRYLLNTVIEQNNFAVIFKAKRADGKLGLIKKFPQLAALIETAIETSRCLILSSVSLPAEAAQAADLAIGMGAASTPALEAALCGIPAITYDPEGNMSHPMHAEGCGHSIFTDFDSMIQSVKDFSQGRQRKTFGYFSHILPDIDPFRDGQAQNRVGHYMKDLLDQFIQGRDKYQAMEYANSAYRKNFGLNKIVHN